MGVGRGIVDAPEIKIVPYPHVIRLRGPWELHAPGLATPRTTIAVPSARQALGLGAGNEPFTLTRRFNWVAPRNNEEIVWLWLDRCCGRTRVLLNDVELGTRDSSWTRFRFEVTTILRPRNELVVTVGPDCSATRSKCDPQWIRGILGGVFLTVEWRQFGLEQVSVLSSWTPTGGSVQADAMARFGDRQSPIHATGQFLLDGEIAHEEPLTIERDEQLVRLKTSLNRVAPWWPRALGSARLYDVAFRVLEGRDVLWEEIRKTGFRAVAKRGNEQWLVNDRPIASPAIEWTPLDSYGRSWDETEFSVDERGQQVQRIRLAAHVAPDELYSLADRLGWLIDQDLPLSVDSRGRPVTKEAVDIVCRLAHHPSIVTWRVVRSACRETQFEPASQGHL